jgi:ribose transport system substrate-binding protein
VSSSGSFRDRAKAWPSIIGCVAASCLALALGACGSSSNASGSDSGTTAASKHVKVYAGIGTASSDYWSAFSEGAKQVAESDSDTSQVLASEFDGQKHLQQFGAIFARGCSNCAVTIDPASTAYEKPIVKAAIKGGAWIVTLWNKPDDFHPWDEDKHFVAHTTFDGVDSGYQNATAMFKAMGGKGNIVALRGVPDNPPAIGRRAGLKKALAENPKVHLLDEQVGDWDSTKGQQIVETWLAKYGGKIDGIFSANDGMAMGAIEALRAKGLAGKVAVTGSDGQRDALEAIKRGDMTSTMYIDGATQGAVTAALATAAARGDIDPDRLTHAQREFYLKQTLVTKDNVDEFLSKKVVPGTFTYDKLKQDFWAQSAGPITYGG